MQFETPLQRGTLIKRHKRFLADVALDGGATITASCPNTGSMLGLATPGLPVWVSHNDSPTRKYRHTLEMVEADLGAGPVLVGINTGRPNALVSAAISAGKISELAGYPMLRREVRYGAASRVDLLLEKPGAAPCYVEIKNVHLMREAGLAEFPDSVTERGARHLEELSTMVANGNRAVMLFLIQRPDATAMGLARDIDPEYGHAFSRAMAAGVEAYAYRCRLTAEAIELDQRVNITAG